MGSQTLEILRQGVWASITGGYFYDPHQGVFCNVVHLYLWLFLLCSPFVAYLYFPGTWPWCIYCILTSVTILGVKLANMALHRLYDRASMSDTNLKHQFFKITKETETRDDDTGIEMKVMGNGSRDSVENAIHEASDENSMMSMENVNSIIDLKVDVHRKNSSESIELLFYPPSRSSQQDQHSIAGSASVSKSLRSNNTMTGAVGGNNIAEAFSNKYLAVYPEHENELPKDNSHGSSSSETAAATNRTPPISAHVTRQSHLLRKSSDDFKRRLSSRRRLERQRSLDAAADSDTRLMRNPPDSMATRNETFLHSQALYHNNNVLFGKPAPSSKMASVSAAASGLASAALTTHPSSSNAQRLPTTTTSTTTTTNAATTNVSNTISNVVAASSGRSARLQRHRSSETHDERLKQQSRGIYLPIHHEQHHHHLHHGTIGASSFGEFIGELGSIGADSMMDADELDLGGSASGVATHVGDGRARALQSWILGSSDVYIEDDSYTKSDLGIEQLDDCQSGNASRTTFLMHQQQQHNSPFQPAQPFRHQRHGGIKRRRHSNATTLFKNNNIGGGRDGGDSVVKSMDTPITAAATALATGPQSSVRRIKSTALEISCPRPSISNLSPHPNSVEAINGQQQIRNPSAALLPPPSKCLVRNPHLTLCPKFGGSFGGSSSSGNKLNFGTNTSSDSTLALIEPVHPIVEQTSERHGDKRKQQKRHADIDVLNIIETAMRIRDVHLDEDDDDAVDDVPVRRRRKALGCQQDRRSVESDVGEILADGDDDDDVDDVDEFKDFDDNLEHILQDLQQTQNELDILKAEYDQEERQQAVLRMETVGLHEGDLDNVMCSKEPTEDDDDDAGPSTSHVMRERLHSTDSETDNKGSRSPLLSGKKWDCGDSNAKAADSALQIEIVAIQQKHKQMPRESHVHSPQAHPHLHDLQKRGEGDSGCPSSDCEQVSASSKDMLLSGLDVHDEDEVTKPKVVESFIQSKDIEEGGADCGRKQSGTSNKNLGAIPKIVKYREVDETSSGRCDSTSTSAVPSCTFHLHKRRGGNNSGAGNCCTTCTVGKLQAHDDRSTASTKAISRTSSSASSCSLHAYSISADLQKMRWFYSGALDEHGCPVMVGPDGRPIPNSVNVAPPNISSVHLQFYQDALQALNASASCHPSSSTDGLSFSERQYAREKMRRSSKQISEPSYNASLAEFSQHALELPSTQLSNTLLNSGGSGRSSLQHHAPYGVVVASSALNSRNVNNAATLSMQGLFDAINEERNAANQARAAGNAAGSSAANAVAAAIQGHIEDICDYWRPACMLSAEKPTVPKSFYKYRINCCGYERDFKISIDRLELLALFDRDLHWLHVILSVVLCAMVAYLGATILQHGYYKDLFAFVFCAVIAGSQYSLVKSVQPDAASPIHGFNKTVAYSRAIYFSLCGGLLLLFEHLKRRFEAAPPQEFIFFGIRQSPSELNATMLQIMYILLLCFPIIFSLGLFPQVNTFLMYFLEQVDMHIFGGNAAGSLLGAFLCVLRSLLGVSLLYGPLYAALVDGKGTQYIVFSIFCAMLIPLGYHLSRSASDFNHLWALVKNCIVSTYRDDDDELSAASSQKLPTLNTPKKRRNERSLEHDLPPVECSNEHIEMSSMAPTDGRGDELSHRQSNLERRHSKSKASSLCSSSQTLGKTISSSKKAITASNSFASVEGAAAGVSEAVVASKNEHSNNTPEGACVDTRASESANQRAENNDDERAIDDEDAEGDKISTSSTTHPGDMSTLTAGGVGDIDGNAPKHDNESPDPLPKKLQTTVNTRLKNDFVVMTFLAVVVLGLHSSTVFTVLQPDLNVVLYAFTGALGLMLHYIVPQMRKHMPWLCFSRPLLRQKEFGQFEVSNAPKVMWFEKVYIYLCMVERNVLFPLLAISALTADTQTISQKYGIAWGTLIVVVCALKFIRNAYSDPTNQYLIVIFTVLLFRVDFALASETFLIDYFVVSVAYRKCCDFLLKLQFIVTYIAPWQITWGSAFHAFAQPFSVPHSAMLFLQAGVSAVLSTPLNPFLGSAIFLTSYVRPIKFWERDYNTRRIDHSNTRLVSQLERDLGADDNNLNSIFYEHLTRSLQHSLCGDLLMGRWGNVNQGDCFVLASDYLNCLVHIIELGNGLCTFQMRGLEFRGTYCQQREVEAITEDVEDNDGCCCCDPGHLPRMLSANAMFSTRWLAWQVVAAQYVLEGYSISDNLASATLQVFEYRKMLITYYIKSIIYYVIKNPKLEQWLASGPIQDALQHTLSRQFVDLDPIFNHNLDEDFDFRAMGITRSSFCYVYLSWINFCCDKRKESQNPANVPPTMSQTSGTSPCNTNNNNNNNSTKDSKSTPNLSMTTLATAGNAAHTAKSQSQQQLRTRPQKSGTMSSSATVSNNHSGEHMASSQSYANILRQTSESAPGLSGAGFSLAFTATSAPATGTAIAAHARLDSASLNNSASTVAGAGGGGDNNANVIRTPQTHVRASSMKAPSCGDSSKAHYKEADSSPLPMSAKVGESREKPIIKLKVPTVAKDSPIVSLCLALGLLARRSLATASHGSLTGVEFFLHGLHALFKGDFRITSPRDEWVFADMELLHAVVAPAVKMALKLQQDHISNPDEFLDPLTLFEAIDTCAKDLVISHEADPVWRSAVLRGAPNLLALRHVMEDGSDEYRIIRLAKRFLSFRVIKLNRECVRGLWAGQQQELIYLRNRNPERGSIQNAKQALRNIINSSCDQPIGYPIYVSPLTTSYADTNEQLSKVIGGAITLESIKSNLLDWWQHIRERCRQGCSSGSALEPSCESGEIAPVYISAPLYNTLTASNYFNIRHVTNVTGVGASLSAQYGSDGLANSLRGSSLAVLPAKPNSTTLLASFLSRDQEAIRDLRGLRKSQTQGTHAGVATGLRSERERRATLPVASTSLGVSAATSAGNSSEPGQHEGSPNLDPSIGGDVATGSSDSRFAKISCSSGSLGIGNIITTPGDYPRKTKGPICLTSVTGGIASDSVKATEVIATMRKPRIDLYKKVIIVDGTEIYDCLDRCPDVIWPNESMCSRGGQKSWKGWVPRVGMVGYVVHIWIPNHTDLCFRSHVNRVVYLVEIGEHFVPVGEYGLREYKQIMGDEASATSSSITTISSRHSSTLYYHDLDEQRQQRENLTPISSSDFESPTDKTNVLLDNGEKIKIQAVSSSSSDDDDDVGLMNFEMQRRDMLMNVWKMIAAEKQQQQQKELQKLTEERAKLEENNETEANNQIMEVENTSKEFEKQLQDQAVGASVAVVAAIGNVENESENIATCSVNAVVVSEECETTVTQPKELKEMFVSESKVSKNDTNSDRGDQSNIATAIDIADELLESAETKNDINDEKPDESSQIVQTSGEVQNVNESAVSESSLSTNDVNNEKVMHVNDNSNIENLSLYSHDSTEV